MMSFTQHIIAADTEVLNTLSNDKKDDLYHLVEYVKHNGDISVPANELSTIETGSSNGIVDIIISSKNADIPIRQTLFD